MNEVTAIFDAVGKASKVVHLHDKIRKLQQRIRDLERQQCGHCDHWMKTSCRPEKVQKQFKSCNSWGCGDFTRNWHTADLIERFERELDDIVKRHGG